LPKNVQFFNTRSFSTFDIATFVISGNHCILLKSGNILNDFHPFSILTHFNLNHPMGARFFSGGEGGLSFIPFLMDKYTQGCPRLIFAMIGIKKSGFWGYLLI
jgi:hypothetical protein